MLFNRRERAIKRILIVEDEPLVAFDNEHFLREHGFDIVATVDRVEEAVAVIVTAKLDLVLADVKLSDGGDGMEVAHAAHKRGVPVLFVTGFCPIEARALAIGCLAKPYSQRALRNAIDAVEACLAGTRPRRMPPGLTLYGRE
jgi:two-component system, response regulator PdtaR